MEEQLKKQFELAKLYREQRQKRKLEKGRVEKQRVKDRKNLLKEN